MFMYTAIKMSLSAASLESLITDSLYTLTVQGGIEAEESCCVLEDWMIEATLYRTVSSK
jgi:hypothetical protein